MSRRALPPGPPRAARRRFPPPGHGCRSVLRALARPDFFQSHNPLSSAEHPELVSSRGLGLILHKISFFLRIIPQCPLPFHSIPSSGNSGFLLVDFHFLHFYCLTLNVHFLSFFVFKAVSLTIKSAIILSSKNHNPSKPSGICSKLRKGVRFSFIMYKIVYNMNIFQKNQKDRRTARKEPSAGLHIIQNQFPPSGRKRKGVCAYIPQIFEEAVNNHFAYCEL